MLLGWKGLNPPWTILTYGCGLCSGFDYFCIKSFKFLLFAAFFTMLILLIRFHVRLELNWNEQSSLWQTSSLLNLTWTRLLYNSYLKKSVMKKVKLYGRPTKHKTTIHILHMFRSYDNATLWSKSFEEVDSS